MKKFNILFLGGAKRVSMARLFKSAGAKLGLDVSIFGYELDRRVPLSVEGDIVVGRRWKDPDLYEHLHATVESLGVGLIVPFVDPAVGVASRFHKLYGKPVAAGPEELSDSMFDKAVADLLFREKNIPVPERILPDSPRFPFIAKPRTGSASKGIVVVKSAADLEGKVFPESQYLLQEFIPDAEEYTVDCYVSGKGEPIGIVPRRRIEVTGGEVSVTETVMNPVLISLSEKVLMSLGFRGPVTLQFLYDRRTGRFLLMEINPRLGGGAVCSVYAGADLPLWILEEAIGETPQPAAEWRDKTRMTRYMQEVIFYE